MADAPNYTDEQLKAMSPAQRFKLATGHDLPEATPEEQAEYEAWAANAERVAREFYGSNAA